MVFSVGLSGIAGPRVLVNGAGSRLSPGVLGRHDRLATRTSLSLTFGTSCLGIESMIASACCGRCRVHGTFRKTGSGLSGKMDSSLAVKVTRFQRKDSLGLVLSGFQRSSCGLPHPVNGRCE